MSNGGHPAELLYMNATRRCSVCVLSFAAALCVSCEQQHLHASLDVPCDMYIMGRTSRQVLYVLTLQCCQAASMSSGRLCQCYLAALCHPNAMYKLCVISGH